MMAFSPFLSLAIAATSHSAHASCLSSRLASVCLPFPCRLAIDPLASASAAVVSAATSSILASDADSAVASGLKLSPRSPSPCLPFNTLLALSSSFMQRSSAVSHSTAAAPAGVCVVRFPARAATLPRLAGPVPVGPAAAVLLSAAASAVFRTPPLAVLAASPDTSIRPARLSVSPSSTQPAEYVRARHALVRVQRSSPSSSSRDHTRNSHARSWSSSHKTTYSSRRRNRKTFRSGNKAGGELYAGGNVAPRARLNEGSTGLCACSAATFCRKRVPSHAITAWQGAFGAGDVRMSRQEQQQRHRAPHTAEQLCPSLLSAAALRQLRKTPAELMRSLSLLTLAPQQAMPLQQEQHAAQQRQQMREGRGDHHKQQDQMSAVELRVASVRCSSRCSSLSCTASRASFSRIALRQRFSTDAAVNYATGTALCGSPAGATATNAVSFPKGGYSVYDNPRERREKHLCSGVGTPIFVPWQQFLHATTLSVCQCAASGRNTADITRNCSSSLCRAAGNGRGCSNTEECSTGPLAVCAPSCHNPSCRRSTAKNGGTTAAAVTLAACSSVAFPAVLAFTAAAAASAVYGAAVSEYLRTTSPSPLAHCCARCLYDGPFVRLRYVSSAGHRCGVNRRVPSNDGAACSASTKGKGTAAVPPMRVFAYSPSSRLSSGGAALLRHFHSRGSVDAAAFPFDTLSTTIVTPAIASSASRYWSGRSAGARGVPAPSSPRATDADSEVPTGCLVSTAATTAQMLVSAPKGATSSVPSVSSFAAAEPTTAPSFVTYPCSRRGEMQQQSQDQVPLQREARGWSAPKQVKQLRKVSWSARRVPQGKKLGRGTAALASLATLAAHPAAGQFAGRSLGAAAAARLKKGSLYTAVADPLRSRVAEGGKLRKMQQGRGRQATAPPFSSLASPAAAAAAALISRVRHSCSSTREAGNGCCATTHPVQQLPQKQHETHGRLQARQLQQRRSDLEKQRCQMEAACARQQQQRQPATHASHQQQQPIPYTGRQQQQQRAYVQQQQRQSSEGAARLWLNVDTLSESTGGAAGDDGDAAGRDATESQTKQRGNKKQHSGREWYLRLMSFNLLADSLTDYKYRALDQNIVCWANREKAIREEILRHRPAIGCLQEVDRSYYWRGFRGFLENSGYESFYKQKTNGREDGLATFWLKGRFEVLERQELELGLYPDQRLGAEPQVALLLLLRERISPGDAKCSDSRSSEGSSEAGNSNRFEGYGSAESTSGSPAVINTTRTCSRSVRQGQRLAGLGAQEGSLRAGVAVGGETRRSAVPNSSGSVASRSSFNSSTSAAGGLSEWKGQEQLTRENVEVGDERAAVATTYASLSTLGKILIVANTHLLFNSRRGDIKLSQLLQLLRGVQEMRGRAVCRVKKELRSPSSIGSRHSPIVECGNAKNHSSTIPLVGVRGVPENDAGQHSEAAERREEVAAHEKLLSATAERVVDVLLCGDFNFTPHSPLYQLLLRGFFDFRGLDRKKLSGQFLMERRAYKVDAQGYHGRGSTVVSSPAESRLLSASDSGIPLVTNCLVGSSLKHSWSTSAVTNAPLRSEQHPGSPLQLQQQTDDIAQTGQHRGPLYSSVSSCAVDMHHPSPQWLRGISRVFTDGSESGDGSVAVPSAQSTSALGCCSGMKASTTTEGNACSDIVALPVERTAHASPWLIRLPFRFRSAYALPRKPHGVAVGGTEESYSREVVMEEPAFTAYHGWQKGCIDYVFYYSNELKVGHVYQFPPLSSATQYGCCPNELWPCSDHYSLVVDLVRTK